MVALPEISEKFEARNPQFGELPFLPFLLLDLSAEPVLSGVEAADSLEENTVIPIIPFPIIPFSIIPSYRRAS